jgi:hypothetical protein
MMDTRKAVGRRRTFVKDEGLRAIAQGNALFKRLPVCPFCQQFFFKRRQVKLGKFWIFLCHYADSCLLKTRPKARENECKVTKTHGSYGGVRQPEGWGIPGAKQG